MRNRHVKFGWRIPNCFGKIATSRQGVGFFWTHTVDFPVTLTSPWQTRDVPVDLSTTSPTFSCLVMVIDYFPVSLTRSRLPICHGNFSNHLDMSWWFETPKHPHDFPVTRSMSVTSPWQVARGAPDPDPSGQISAEFGRSGSDPMYLDLVRMRPDLNTVQFYIIMT